MVTASPTIPRIMNVIPNRCLGSFSHSRSSLHGSFSPSSGSTGGGGGSSGSSGCSGSSGGCSSGGAVALMVNVIALNGSPPIQ